MIANKHITAIVAVIVTLSVVFCLCGFVYAGKLTEELGGTGLTMEYETELFDTGKIISVDIKMDNDQWNGMLDNAISETYYRCDVVVNGKTFYSVGIRPKGNTSLSAIATDPDNNRYSFKLEFDRFIEGQTCFGLDKLILNNNYADATNMKEAVIYDMYQHLDADASLYNYADISVNGSYWGVYLALEAVEDSFLLRNYGVKNINLYKPDSMDMGGMGGDNKDTGKSQPGGNMPEGFDPSQFGGSMPEGFDPSQSGGKMPSDGQSGNRPDTDIGSIGGVGGFTKSGSGANLEYTDDDLDSYSTIWDGSVNDTSKPDHRRVVTALKNLSEGKDLETYIDVDNVLKYMAVHSFAVNEDSLSGMMAHNYCLCEYGGRLNILPWDYNLSFGGMSMNGISGASDVVNDPIDSPFSGTTFFDVLLENEEYLARYHEYYRQLVENYVNNGEFDSFYTGTRAQIDSLVETDPNAMYTNDEYKVAVSMLYDTVKLRGESIKGQLDGTIPSTAAGQRADSSALIDASSIDISAMGTFSMGGGGGSGGKSFDSSNGDNGEETQQASTQVTPVSLSLSASPSGQPPAGFDPSQSGGSLPEGFDPSQFGSPPQTGSNGQPETNPSSQTETGSSSQTETDLSSQPETDSSSQSETNPGSQSEDGTSGDRTGKTPQMPSGFGTGTNTNSNGNLIWMGISAIVIAAGLLFACMYSVRSRKR